MITIKKIIHAFMDEYTINHIKRPKRIAGISWFASKRPSRICHVSYLTILPPALKID